MRLGEERAAAFSKATVERGRLLGRSEAWDGGRRCHERGERAAEPVAEGEVMVRLVRFWSESKGDSFSLVGESEYSFALSIESDAWPRRDRGLPGFSGPGENKPAPSMAEPSPMRWAVGEGVFAGEDFCGEIDLARSAESGQKAAEVSKFVDTKLCDAVDGPHCGSHTSSQRKHGLPESLGGQRRTHLLGVPGVHAFPAGSSPRVPENALRPLLLGGPSATPPIAKSRRPRQTCWQCLWI